jgi:small acid-soluble spore protein F (minor alpha/beta-type SASP)
MGRRRRGLMSESFKTELARDLGFYNVVQSSGWEGIRAKDAGNMVKRAIQIAEEHLAKQSGAGNQQTWFQQTPDQRRYRP